MQKIKTVEITQEQIKDLRARIEAHALKDNDYTLFDAFVQSYSLFQQALEEKNITINKLRSVFGKKTEKVSKVTLPKNHRFKSEVQYLRKI